MKSLGVKAYGSIPHLPGSRVGPADHSVNEGQYRMACVERKDKRDEVIVTEKLDGSCCAIAKIDGQLYPLVRSGYIANTSPYEQHHLFYDWVMTHHKKWDRLIYEGERFVGEWLAMAHGTKYDLFHEPFVVFDIIVGDERRSYVDLWERAGDPVQPNFITPVTINHGLPMSIDEVMGVLGDEGFHGAEATEGAVWRIERDEKFLFSCKYVRHDKVDGKYFDKEIWNWRP